MSSEAAHRALELEAESTRLPQCDDLTSYDDKHLELRQRMLQARYPHIHAESITIQCFIKGMHGAETFKRLARKWITSPTTSLHSLKAGATVHQAFEAD